MLSTDFPPGLQLHFINMSLFLDLYIIQCISSKYQFEFDNDLSTLIHMEYNSQPKITQGHVFCTSETNITASHQCRMDQNDLSTVCLCALSVHLLLKPNGI